MKRIKISTHLEILFDITMCTNPNCRDQQTYKKSRDSIRRSFVALLPAIMSLAMIVMIAIIFATNDFLVLQKQLKAKDGLIARLARCLRITRPPPAASWKNRVSKAMKSISCFVVHWVIHRLVYAYTAIKHDERNNSNRHRCSLRLIIANMLPFLVVVKINQCSLMKMELDTFIYSAMLITFLTPLSAIWNGGSSPLSGRWLIDVLDYLLGNSSIHCGEASSMFNRRFIFNGLMKATRSTLLLTYCSWVLDVKRSAFMDAISCLVMLEIVVKTINEDWYLDNGKYLQMTPGALECMYDFLVPLLVDLNLMTASVKAIHGVTPVVQAVAVILFLAEILLKVQAESLVQSYQSEFRCRRHEDNWDIDLHFNTLHLIARLLGNVSVLLLNPCRIQVLCTVGDVMYQLVVLLGRQSAIIRQDRTIDRSMPSIFWPKQGFSFDSVGICQSKPEF